MGGDGRGDPDSTRPALSDRSRSHGLSGSRPPWLGPTIVAVRATSAAQHAALVRARPVGLEPTTFRLAKTALYPLSYGRVDIVAPRHRHMSVDQDRGGGDHLNHPAKIATAARMLDPISAPIKARAPRS